MNGNERDTWTWHVINLYQEEVGDKTIVIHLIVHVPYKVVYDHPKNYGSTKMVLLHKLYG